MWKRKQILSHKIVVFDSRIKVKGLDRLVFMEDQFSGNISVVELLRLEQISA